MSTWKSSHIFMLISMISVFLFITISDIFMAINKISGDTFSELWGKALHNSLFFQLSLGILLGHLCWHISQQGYKPPALATISALTMLGLIALAMDIPYWIGVTQNSFLLLRRYPIILIEVSILIGYFLWPQKLLSK